MFPREASHGPLLDLSPHVNGGCQTYVNLYLKPGRTKRRLPLYRNTGTGIKKQYKSRHQRRSAEVEEDAASGPTACRTLVMYPVLPAAAVARKPTCHNTRQVTNTLIK